MKDTIRTIGAIIGDINGSKYEFNNIRSKQFDLFQDDMSITDDSVLTFAVMDTFNQTYAESTDIKDAKWQKTFKETLISKFKEYGKRFPFVGYGGRFRLWLQGFNHYEPYCSFGNGSAMRVSPVAWIAHNEDEVKLLSRLVSEITHNHPEGIKGAEATAMAIYLARTDASKEQIKQRMIHNYYPEIETLDYEILRKTYEFWETCQQSVPQAIYCFLISNDFEDCLRTTISIGGDCDTTSAISCAIASAYYGLPQGFEEKTKHFFINELVEVVEKFMLLITKEKN